MKSHEVKVKVVNIAGIHARPSAKIIEIVNRFEAEVFLIKEDDDVEVNAASIMGLLMMGASYGTELTIKAKGKQAVEVVEALIELIHNGFGEELA